MMNTHMRTRGRPAQETVCLIYLLQCSFVDFWHLLQGFIHLSHVGYVNARQLKIPINDKRCILYTWHTQMLTIVSSSACIGGILSRFLTRRPLFVGAAGKRLFSASESRNAAL
jgi:hypothetical protein